MVHGLLPKLSDFLVSAPADAEELQPAFFVTEEIPDRVLVRLIQADDLVLFEKRKANGRQGRSRRRMGIGKTSQRNMMIDQISILEFEVKAFRAYLITPDILLKFRLRDFDECRRCCFCIKI